MKVEEYDNYSFIVIRAVRSDRELQTNLPQLDVTKLCIFLGQNFLVSAHAGPSPTVSKVAAGFAATGASKQVSAARIAHLLSDSIIDAYFPILDEVDRFVEALERSDLSQGDVATLEAILRIRRLAFAAHRSLKPHRDVFDILAHRQSAFIGSDVRLYFRDVYDHALRVTESLESYRELIADTTDSYIAQFSMRLNLATRAFSAIATVATPFIIVSGVYGMNFVGMPLTKFPGGFWVVVAVQLMVSIMLFLFFARRKLI